MRPLSSPPPVDTALVRRAALRLALHATVATFLVVATLITVVGVLLVRDADANATSQLTTAADRADDVDDPPAGMWIAMRTGQRISATHGMPSGFPLRAALDRVAAGGAVEDAIVTVGGRDYRVRTQPRTAHPDTQVQVVLDEAPAQAQRLALLRVLAEAGLIGLVLTSALGVWMGARAVRPLQAALVLQRRFVTDASHELRTPLTLLSTRAQMLRRKLRQPAVDEDALVREADSVIADAGHLGEILDDLLLVADLRAPVDADIDMVALVAAVLDAARSGAAELGVAVELDAPARATVRGTEAGLRRAVTAVVDNAVRYAVHRVAATISTTSSQVVVEIADDGRGIDAAVLPRVFERFATTGPPRQDRARQYGIGLALVGDVITRHGGAVTAVNPPGGGAAFRIVLPSAPRTAARDGR
jgi:two-component system OmpR family sensor kinase